MECGIFCCFCLDLLKCHGLWYGVNANIVYILVSNVSLCGCLEVGGLLMKSAGFSASFPGRYTRWQLYGINLSFHRSMRAEVVFVTVEDAREWLVICHDCELRSVKVKMKVFQSPHDR